MLRFDEKSISNNHIRSNVSSFTSSPSFKKCNRISHGRCSRYVYYIGVYFWHRPNYILLLMMTAYTCRHFVVLSALDMTEHYPFMLGWFNWRHITMWLRREKVGPQNSAELGKIIKHLVDYVYLISLNFFKIILQIL